MDVVVYDKIGKESDRLENLLLATFPQKTITDAPIASFADGADDIPIKSLSVAIEPVQDLHGYDNPWPGGGWKNKYNPDDSQIGQRINTTTGLIEEGGLGWWASGFIPVKSGDVIRRTETGTVRQSFYNVDKTSATYVGGSNGATAPSDGFFVFCGLTDSIAPTAQIIVTINDDDMTWTPYSNICPISGHTSANVTRTGVNVWDEETEFGVIDATTGALVDNSNRARTKNYIPVVGGTTYYFYSGTAANDAFTIVYYGKGKEFLSGTYKTFNSAVTVPDGVYYIKFVLPSVYGATYTHDISINYPSTDTDYHKGTVDTYPITFPSGTGTVYGGNITVNQDGSGSLVVDKASKTISRSDSSIISMGSTNVTGKYRVFIDEIITDMVAPSASTVKAPIISNIYKTVTAQGTFTCIDGISAVPSKRIYIYDSNIQTLEAFLSLLDATPLTVVYELATPITIPLTAPQITTLLGTNNIWADTGNIESLTYRANLGDYINNAITTAVANALNV